MFGLFLPCTQTACMQRTNQPLSTFLSKTWEFRDIMLVPTGKLYSVTEQHGISFCLLSYQELAHMVLLSLVSNESPYAVLNTQYITRNMQHFVVLTTKTESMLMPLQYSVAVLRWYALMLAPNRSARHPCAGFLVMWVQQAVGHAALCHTPQHVPRPPSLVSIIAHKASPPSVASCGHVA